MKTNHVYNNWDEYARSPNYTFDQLRSSPINIEFADGTSYKRDEYGDQWWYKDGLRHRDGDLPAVIYADGDQFWYRNGHSHRDGNRPAAIWANGEQRWYRNGVQYNPKETA
jgi:hypothetical protein